MLLLLSLMLCSLMLLHYILSYFSICIHKLAFDLGMMKRYLDVFESSKKIVSRPQVFCQATVSYSFSQECIFKHF